MDDPRFEARPTDEYAAAVRENLYAKIARLEQAHADAEARVNNLAAGCPEACALAGLEAAWLDWRIGRAIKRLGRTEASPDDILGVQ